MLIKGLRVGFCLTGSFCTLDKVLPQVRKLTEEGAEVTPILSEAVATLDTRFGEAAYWKQQMEEITKKPLITSIPQAEPIGPRGLLDVIVVAPCTGNTIAKLANGITDTTVTMACKAHMRNNRPVLLAVSTNDALSMNAQNIGRLMNVKNIYFVPLRQDDPMRKATSLVADMDMILPTLLEALQGRQLEPVLL